MLDGDGIDAIARIRAEDADGEHRRAVGVRERRVGGRCVPRRRPRLHRQGGVRGRAGPGGPRRGSRRDRGVRHCGRAALLPPQRRRRRGRASPIASARCSRSWSGARRTARSRRRSRSRSRPSRSTSARSCASSVRRTAPRPWRSRAERRRRVGKPPIARRRVVSPMPRRQRLLPSVAVDLGGCSVPVVPLKDIARPRLRGTLRRGGVQHRQRPHARGRPRRRRRASRAGDRPDVREDGEVDRPRRALRRCGAR